MSSTISDLNDGGVLQSTDRIPIARLPFAVGDNFYILGSEFNNEITPEADGFFITSGNPTARTFTQTGSNFTLTGAANSFTLLGGTGTSRTLTLLGDSALNQNLRITDIPTFASLISTSSSITLDANTLTVNGNSSLDQDLLTSSNVVFTEIKTDAVLGKTAATPLSITPISGQNLNISLSTTGDFVINTNQFYVDTSSTAVAVGSSVIPAGAKFYISDNQGGASGDFSFLANVISGYRATFSLDNTGLKIQHNSSLRNIEFGVNSTSALFITTGNQVTVGSPGGSELFRVNGSVGFYNSSVPYFLASQSSNSPTIQFGSSSASSTNLTFVSSTTSGQNINFNDTGSNKGVIHYNHNANYMEFSVETTSMGRIYNTGWAIGTSFAPTYLFHMRTSSATQRLWADFQVVGQTTMSQTHPGIFITAGAMNTTNKYTPGLLFGSTDTDFTTTNPKFLAGITAEATQTYSSDLTGGMALNFWTSPNAAGATPVPLQRMRIDEVGRVGIKIENPVSSLHVRDTNSSSNQSGITIEDNGTGDPILHLLIGASTEYVMGIDNSDNDKLIIGGGPTPDALPMIVATTAGEITMPLQPAFVADKSSASNNVTGNGTVYTVIFDVERFDQNSDYNNTTGVFTSPVTGRYRFESNVHFNNLNANATIGDIRLVTSNKTYPADLYIGVIRNSSNFASMNGSWLADMDAADTARINVYVSGTTLSIGVYGEATVAFTRFSGNLVV